jgi:hypothetical protein
LWIFDIPPWMGDRLTDEPHFYRATQTKEKRVHIFVFNVGLEPAIPMLDDPKPHSQCSRNIIMVNK